MLLETAVLLPQQLTIGHRDHEHPPVRKPSEARGPCRDFRDHRVAALKIDRVHRMEVHVGVVELAAMPSRPFAESQIIKQYFKLSHGSSATNRALARDRGAVSAYSLFERAGFTQPRDFLRAIA